MSRTLLPAKDLAALKVPGFPTSKRGINRLAAANNWPTVEGPRGAKLIDFNELPLDLRRAIQRRIDQRQIADGEVHVKRALRAATPEMLIEELRRRLGGVK